MSWKVIAGFGAGIAAIAGGGLLVAFVPGAQVAGAALITAGTGWLGKVSSQPEWMRK